MNSNDELIQQSGAEAENGFTLIDLFKLVLSISDELKSLRSDFEHYVIRTSPRTETLEAIRMEVGAVGDRQDVFDRTLAEMRSEMNGMRGEMNDMGIEMNGLRGDVNNLRGQMSEMRGEMAETRRINFGIETKLDGLSTMFSELQGSLHHQAVRLLELESSNH
jgi:chromosome segregation ATPase